MFDTNSFSLLFNTLFNKPSEQDNPPHQKVLKAQKTIEPLQQYGFEVSFEVDGNPIKVTLNAWNESNAWAEVLTSYPTAIMKKITKLYGKVDVFS